MTDETFGLPTTVTAEQLFLRWTSSTLATLVRAAESLPDPSECSCTSLRRHEHPPFGGVRRDPSCPIHGDDLLPSGDMTAIALTAQRVGFILSTLRLALESNPPDAGAIQVLSEASRMVTAARTGTPTAVLDEARRMLRALDRIQTADCICRTSGCGHLATQHVGPNGACIICKQECWS